MKFYGSEPVAFVATADFGWDESTYCDQDSIVGGQFGYLLW